MIGPPVQIAYGVDDVRVAAQQWTAKGAGPFFVLDHIEVAHTRIRGMPAVFDHSSAYGWWGAVMIELICQHDPGPDPFVGTGGVHHVAHFVDDVHAAQQWLVARGCAESLYAETSTGTAFAMHDARHETGHHIEIYRETDGLRRFYDMVRGESATWFAQAPIREVR